MARTPSTMLDLGTPLPVFSLTDAVSGKAVTDATARGKVAVIMFICNHCPFVKHVVDELDRLDAGAEQRPSLGCNIKWKPGAAPAWFG